MNSATPPNREEEIFEQALLLAGPQRLAFVQNACGADTALFNRVLALLLAASDPRSSRGNEAHTSVPQPSTPSSPPPDQSLLTSAATVQGENPPGTAPIRFTEQVGDKIGHYRLREKIGEGGYGIVYVAEQEEPVRRKVALKVIKLGMDTREVVARFEAERQALALMDHPNIARVFDGGATDAGRPYFVLELVRGTKITDYCDQHNLPTVERLKLFIQVCQAIQHAHQKGIIHRDIKPANILVSLHDDVAVPKVIDFGIAKAIGGQLTDKTVYTALEQFMGTPAYMSPEQAGRSDLDIDTRSDIYALGVLLYELLAGRPPFDPKQLLASGLDEMIRCIREEEPLRPSTRLSRLEREELTTMAQRRGTEPPKLISLLKGDLDWIVMKCLEKNRARRYEAANALAHDIECHLNQEPVTARPPSTSYRVGKFVRRNKMLVGAGSAVALALVLGIVGSTWQAWRATRAEGMAENALKNEAEQRQQAQKAQANEAQLRKQAQAQAYASDMKAAQVALQQNNRGTALDLLRRHLPKPGDEDLRGLEWRYLWQECRGDELQSFSHPGDVYSAALSPDGRHLATTSEDNKVRVWEVATARQVQEFEAKALLRSGYEPGRKSVGFSPDGKWLAAAGKNGVEIRETAHWGLVKELQSSTAPLCFSSAGTLVTSGTTGMEFWDLTNGHHWVVTNAFATGNNLAVSPDETLLACGNRKSMDYTLVLQVQIELWEVRTGSKRVIPGTYDVASLAISPDGKWLACGSEKGEVWLWDLARWAPFRRFRANEGIIQIVAFSPDSQRLATAGSDQQIQFWETATTNKLGTLQGHLSQIWALEFSPDAQKLVSASTDGTAKLWSTKLDSTKGHRFTVPLDSSMYGPVPDGTAWTTGDYKAGNFQTWSLPDGRLLQTMPWKELDPQGNGFRDVMPAPGNHALYAATTNGMIHLLSPATGARLRSIQVGETNFTLWSVSPDHRWLLGMRSDEKTGLLFDLRAPPRVYYLPDFILTVMPAAFSPDSRWLAYGATNYAVKLWDLAANREKATLRRHRKTIGSVGFSPDGRWLASAAEDGDVWIWSVASAKPIFDTPLKGNRAGICLVVFSSDSMTLGTFGFDQTLRWWNVSTGQEMLLFQADPGWLTSVLDFPASWHPGRQFIMWYDRPEQLRVTTVPSLAEIDAAEAQARTADQSKGVLRP